MIVRVTRFAVKLALIVGLVVVVGLVVAMAVAGMGASGG